MIKNKIRIHINGKDKIKMGEKTEELVVQQIDQANTLNIPAKVLLFNDDYHSFDEVIFQLIKAINCSLERAEALTWEVHTRGKAMVFEGDMSECLRVSSILEEINLSTQIEY